MEKENKMPELAVVEKEETFNHDDHMAKVKAGLEQIIASQDLNEIKSIAQSLLEEEGKEAEQEIEVEDKGNNEEVSMEDYLNK